MRVERAENLPFKVSSHGDAEPAFEYLAEHEVARDRIVE
jgi:hypothetical protein